MWRRKTKKIKKGGEMDQVRICLWWKLIWRTKRLFRRRKRRRRRRRTGELVCTKQKVALKYIG